MSKEYTFEDNVTEFAERLSRVMEERFQIEVKSCEAVMPPPPQGEKVNGEAASIMLDTLMEYMFGTAVAISCHYISTEKEFEQYVIDMIRDKFVKIRKMKKKGEFKPEVVHGRN